MQVQAAEHYLRQVEHMVSAESLAVNSPLLDRDAAFADVLASSMFDRTNFSASMQAEAIGIARSQVMDWSYHAPEATCVLPSPNSTVHARQREMLLPTSSHSNKLI